MPSLVVPSAAGKPYIVAVYPSEGWTTGGTRLCIVGMNFCEGVEVVFGTLPAPCEVGWVWGYYGGHCYCCSITHCVMKISFSKCFGLDDNSEEHFVKLAEYMHYITQIRTK